MYQTDKLDKLESYHQHIKLEGMGGMGTGLSNSGDVVASGNLSVMPGDIVGSGSNGGGGYNTVLDYSSGGGGGAGGHHHQQHHHQTMGMNASNGAGGGYGDAGSYGDYQTTGATSAGSADLSMDSNGKCKRCVLLP